MSNRIELTKADLVQQEKCMDEVRRILLERYPDRQPLAFTHSYGCQQNVSDGEKIRGMLAEMGYGFTNQESEADCILFNTCAVRENAEFRIYGNVGNLKQYKRANPNLIIGLCGCMMQQEHVAKKIRESYPYVDLIFGTHASHLLPSMLEKRLRGQKHVEEIQAHDGFIVEDMPIRRDGTVKAWLPIMYGCDNFCTYCIVPYVRGRERSRRPEKILEDVRQLAAQGYKEIMLLGQNVNSYGKGLDEPVDFTELLRRIDEEEGDFRVRFMTSHPKDCTREMIDVIAQSRKLCHHIHLPVQSGSDRILQQMNRHYDTRKYLDLIDYAKAKIPDLTLSSDIIVGFPGETYEDFCATLALIRKVEYDFLFTFIYSKRVGTKAASMDDPVPAAEKSKWFRELLSAQSEISQKRFTKLIGSVQQVLVDGPAKEGTGRVGGKSGGNITVECPGDGSLTGQLVNVRITEAHNWGVIGERQE
ncbi:MAG: tRNA (N6-isopentenyl adenosine(37)-C2)-methylthiotransferase MiaB [Oscillospiraceae bacterium]|nr:tRNA (N6-isopentenyl adenosine(37)-C2)-methylthiotransferase MiaB [Oscillospiraceae bacterium]